jgi:hypothetical protein
VIDMREAKKAGRARVGRSQRRPKDTSSVTLSHLLSLIDHSPITALFKAGYHCERAQNHYGGGDIINSGGDCYLSTAGVISMG